MMRVCLTILGQSPTLDSESAFSSNQSYHFMVLPVIPFPDTPNLLIFPFISLKSPFVMIKSDACSRKNHCHASNRPVLASFSRATHADAELPMGRHTGHGCYCAPEVLDSSLLDLPMVAMLLGSMNTLKSLNTSKYYIEYQT